MMRDYAELVRALRIFNVNYDSNKLTNDAADAIEELLAEVEHWKLEAAANETDRKYLIDENRKLVNSLMNFRVPTWISVEERLPKFGERVLVSNGGFVCESFLSQSGRWQRGGVDMFFMTPTHWCEMPESPKEENKR